MWILLFALVCAAHGVWLYLSLKKEGKKLGRKKYLLVASFILSILIAGIGYYQQYVSAQEKREQNIALQAQVQGLSDQIGYLKGQQQELLDGNRALLTAFGRVSDIFAEVRKTSPMPASQPIAQTSQPQLVELKEKRSRFIDPATGLSHSLFVFRSRNVVPLRDIRIELTFGRPVRSVTTRLLGAFVIEQGTRDSLVSPTSYHYRTDYLSQSNDILIDVASNGGAALTDMNVSP